MSRFDGRRKGANVGRQHNSRTYLLTYSETSAISIKSWPSANRASFPGDQGGLSAGIQTCLFSLLIENTSPAFTTAQSVYSRQIGQVKIPRALFSSNETPEFTADHDFNMECPRAEAGGKVVNRKYTLLINSVFTRDPFCGDIPHHCCGTTPDHFCGVTPHHCPGITYVEPSLTTAAKPRLITSLEPSLITAIVVFDAAMVLKVILSMENKTKPPAFVLKETRSGELKGRTARAPADVAEYKKPLRQGPGDPRASCGAAGASSASRLWAVPPKVLILAERQSDVV
ncbi:hypothetical protein AAG570_011596 [Ranatra chinensis]|uniref:Uncharacterized protein n=1 Tax=Ranatra chinensis TaxID=642074 RepID=A0ABD0YL33_9HEMI